MTSRRAPMRRPSMLAALRYPSTDAKGSVSPLAKDWSV